MKYPKELYKEFGSVEFKTKEQAQIGRSKIKMPTSDKIYKRIYLNKEVRYYFKIYERK